MVIWWQVGWTKAPPSRTDYILCCYKRCILHKKVFKIVLHFVFCPIVSYLSDTMSCSYLRENYYAISPLNLDLDAFKFHFHFSKTVKLREGSRKKNPEKVWSFAKPPSDPPPSPPSLVFFRWKNLTPIFFVEKCIYIGWNKFYTKKKIYQKKLLKQNF